MPVTSEEVAIYTTPRVYYRNQVQDEHGTWRDVAPSFVRLKDAMQAAQDLSLETAQDVRTMKFTKTEEENN